MVPRQVALLAEARNEAVGEEAEEEVLTAATCFRLHVYMWCSCLG